MHKKIKLIPLPDEPIVEVKEKKNSYPTRMRPKTKQLFKDIQDVTGEDIDDIMFKGGVLYAKEVNRYLTEQNK